MRSWFAGVERLRKHTGAALAAVKGNANKFDEARMIDISRCGHDEIAVLKLARVVADSGFVIEVRYGFGCAFDWTTERLIRKVSSVEKFA